MPADKKMTLAQFVAAVQGVLSADEWALEFSIV